VPGHAPDHLLVRIIDHVQHSLTPRTFRQPEDDFTIVRGRGEELFFVRVPLDDCHLFLMALEAIELSVHFADIKDLNLMITTTGKEPVAVDRVPLDLVDRRVMCMDLVDKSSALPRIPYLDVLVLATGQDKRLEWVPVAGFDV